MQKNPTEKAQQANPLPDFYYLDNFEYLLRFIFKRYEAILSEKELAFYHDFFALSKNERALYVRFYNRKGVFFRLDKIAYAELGEITSYKDRLIKTAFIQGISSYQGNTFEKFSLLRLLLKAELLSFFPSTDERKALKKLHKDDLLLVLHEACTWDQILEGIRALGLDVIKQNYEPETDLFHFLFFGRLGNAMTDFVVRDLGHVTYEKVAEESLSTRFEDRKELNYHFEIALLSRLFYQMSKLFEFEVLLEWWQEELSEFEWQTYYPSKRWDKLIARFGKICEQNGCHEEAIGVYKHSFDPSNRERLLRLLIKGDRKSEAEVLCRSIIENPERPKDLIIAEDLLQKILGEKFLKSTTKFVKEAESIEVVQDSSVRVEQLAIDYYEKEGSTAWHVENYLWNAIFGLTFWELLFDASSQAFYHPLQSRPSGLYDVDFFEGLQKSVDQTLQKTKTKNAFKAHLIHVIQMKWGIANPLVHWHEALETQVLQTVKLLPLKGLRAVLMQMTKGLKGHSSGFPDLFVFKGRKFHFIEIKSPNDHLSEQQLFWIQFLNQQKIPSKIIRLKFI